MVWGKPYWLESSLSWAEHMINYYDSLKPMKEELLHMYKRIKEDAINSLKCTGSIIGEQTEEIKQVYYFHNLLWYIDRIREESKQKDIQDEQKEKEIFKKYINKILDSFLDNDGMKTKD